MLVLVVNDTSFIIHDLDDLAAAVLVLPEIMHTFGTQQNGSEAIGRSSKRALTDRPSLVNPG